MYKTSSAIFNDIHSKSLIDKNGKEYGIHQFTPVQAKDFTDTTVSISINGNAYFTTLLKNIM